MKIPLASLIVGLVFTCSALAQSLPYSDPLTSSDSKWTSYGSGTYSSSGLSSSSSSTAITLVSNVVPSVTNDYEIRMQLNITQSGGYYVLLMRASSPG